MPVILLDLPCPGWFVLGITRRPKLGLECHELCWSDIEPQTLLLTTDGLKTCQATRTASVFLQQLSRHLLRESGKLSLGTID